jgi:hypothetical protein
MAISFRVVMILVCAYAGWEIASLQFGELPEPQQLPQKVVPNSNWLTPQ